MSGNITSEMGSLAIVGILIVFGVLALIASVVALLKRLDDRWQDHEARQSAAALDKEPNKGASGRAKHRPTEGGEPPEEPPR